MTSIDHRLTTLPLLAPLGQEEFYLISGKGPLAAGPPALTGAFFTAAERFKAAGGPGLTPAEIPLGKLRSHIEAGNYVFFLARTGLAAGLATNGNCRLPSRREGLHVINQFGMKVTDEARLAPRLDDLRWVFPCDKASARSILELYQPSIRAGRLRKALYRFLISVNMTSEWAPCRVIAAARNGVTGREKTLSVLIGRILGRDDIRLGFFTGTPGYYSKVTAQAITGSGGIIAYCKIGATGQASGLIAREARTLDLLDGRTGGDFSVPKLIRAGQMHGYQVLLQSAPAGSRPGPLQLTDRHIAALCRMQKISAGPRRADASEFFSNIRTRMDWLAARLDSSTHFVFKAAAAKIISQGRDAVSIHGVCHRDFTPWNTKITAGGLHIFDWEWSVSEGPPFIDLLHFLVSVYIVKGMDAGQIMDRLLVRDEGVILKYAAASGAPGGWKPFLLLYLLDLLTFYAEADILDGGRDSFSNRHFSTRFDLLRRFLRT